MPAQPRWWTRAVQVVCIDPYEGYRRAIRSLRASTGIAVDPFHVVDAIVMGGR
ncbi:transposase [Candidatus Poriferisocius sp.]|uniref:transposase n=1 Tax=Candidatus Poriferisocius sp. TaxID=3101276 RepID=UPI003B596800